MDKLLFYVMFFWWFDLVVDLGDDARIAALNSGKRAPEHRSVCST